jgi:mevalonate kinase
MILFGEHAVVYNRPAIAAPVFQVAAKAIVRAEPRNTPGLISIQAPGIGLDTSLERLPPEHPLATATRLVLEQLGIPRAPACTIRITSTIPVAAGLGSGAAVSVALIRALSAFLGRPLPDERVSSLAFEVDKLHHGTPSGIDNTVITYRMPVYFQRDRPVETFRIAQPITIAIGDTGIACPTAAAVGDLRRLWQADPDHYEALFDRIGSIVQQARLALEQGKGSSLGPMMDENHALLQELGVSSPELDRLVEVARTAGALGAKLSGGGRGGNMIALASNVGAAVIAQALESAGARRVLVTTVSTAGQGSV